MRRSWFFPRPLIFRIRSENSPPSAINKEFFKESQNNSHTYCPWKVSSKFVLEFSRFSFLSLKLKGLLLAQGEASYYDIHVGSKVLQDAAWYVFSLFSLRQSSTSWFWIQSTKNAKTESVSYCRYYPETKPGKAETLKGFVAFYKNKVEIHSWMECFVTLHGTGTDRVFVVCSSDKEIAVPPLSSVTSSRAEGEIENYEEGEKDYGII